ncbi:hypothetical protein ACFWJT_11330 [Streptomyces sp. NPDC127069]|uniref:hypothetical protein n=1 Tax=Streptomyces sp. NPDC127069 TaxID=3347128 RepID=UPI0036680A10
MFSVERVFDLKGWTGLLVAGVVRSGVVKAGMVLHDRETSRAVRVTGIVLAGRREEPDAATLVVDRRDGGSVREGADLVAGPEPLPGG